MENYGDVDDVLGGAGHFVGDFINLGTDCEKIRELLSWQFVEDCPWLLLGIGQMNKSQLEWPSGNDTL